MHTAVLKVKSALERIIGHATEKLLAQIVPNTKRYVFRFISKS